MTQPGTRPGHPAPPPAANAVDKMPKTDAEWVAFAQLPVAERSAAYLRSIRAMIMFFTVLTVIGIGLAFYLGLRSGSTTG